MSGSRQSILILGNETGDAGIIRDALRGQENRFEIVYCPSIEEVLHKAEQVNVDILFLDGSSLNGGLRETISRIKSCVGESPSIVVLSVQDRSTGDALLDSGACDYLMTGRADPASLPGIIRSVIQRRKLATALAFSEERYARLLRSVTDYTYTVVIRYGRPETTSHSPGCAAVTGYTPDDYESDPHLWFRMIHDADRPAVLRMISQVLSDETPAPFEHRIIHKSGGIRWIRNTPLSRRDQQGKLIAYDGLVTDITARKLAEQALCESETRYRTLVDTTPNGIFLLDRDLRVLFVNNAGARLLAGKPEDIVGKKHENVFPWEVAGKQEELARKVFISGEPAETDLLHFADAREIWNFTRLVPVFGDNGSVSAVLGVIVDITERKHAEKALRDGEQRLQREFLNVQRAKKEWEITFDTLRDPIFIHDRDCRIIRANKAYQEAAGVPFEDLIGKPFYTIFPKLEDSVASKWRELRDRAGRHPYFFEEFDVPSLKRIFRGRAYPVLDDTGILLYAIQVLEDVTETRQEMEISANLLTLAETTTEIMDIDRLQERIVGCCGGILSADCMFTYLRDRQTGVMKPQYAWGLQRELMPIFKTTAIDPAASLIRAALTECRPVAAYRKAEAEGHEELFTVGPLVKSGEYAAVGEDPPPMQWIKDVSTFLAIPLMDKTESLGLLIACYRSPRVFSDRDRLIAHGISRQVSLAVNAAYLHRMAMERSMELAHKMETLKVIREIDLSILSSLQPREILETAVRNVSRIVSSDRAEALLLDRNRHFTRICGHDEGPEQETAAPLVGETQAVEVMAECRPRYIADLRETERSAKEDAIAPHRVVRSLIMLPLIVKGEAVGVLGVGSRRPAAFTPENLETLEQLADQIGVAFDNTRLFVDLQELFLGTVKSLSYAIDAKSSWTAGHSERVTRYAQLIGRERGFSEREMNDLELAGLLHDVGKLGTFDSILDKKSTLDTEEFTIIKRHPVHGAEMLKPIRQMERIIPAVRHHHERYDGSGYPDGLSGQDIPDLARVLAVADAFDSMTGWRPYRRTFTQREAIEELRRCAGTQFDPLVVNDFITSLEKQSSEAGHAA